MEWKEYKELAEKTLSTEFHCGYKNELLLHAVMGILTEVEELLENYDENKYDSTNVLEEVGDIFWYLSIIGRIYNTDYTYSENKSNDPMKTIISIVKNSCKLLDYMKKGIYYNKSIDQEQFLSITNTIMVSLSEYVNYYEIDPKMSFDINIAKLKARYGEKFSSDRAINRDLSIERSILESK